MDNKAAPRAFYKPFATILLVSLVLSGVGVKGYSSAFAQEGPTATPASPDLTITQPALYEAVPDDSLTPNAAPTPAEPPIPGADAYSHSQEGDEEIIPLSGTTRYVSTAGTDSGDCSNPVSPCLTIRYAIQNASNGETIKVAIGIYRSTFANPVLYVSTQSLTITGGWDEDFAARIGSSILEGQTGSPTVTILGPGTAILENFLVRNGGTGISVGGQLTLHNILVTGSEVVGIHVQGSGSLTLKNSTVTRNASRGIQEETTGTISVQNSIIAGNNGISAPDCSGLINLSDHNVIGSTLGCAVTEGPGDHFNVDPLLSAYPVGPYGYYTLLAASPAIDAGDAGSCLQEDDQRGMPRPQGASCDAGAYEYVDSPGAPVKFGVASGDTQRAATNTAFGNPLAVYVVDAAGSAVAGVEVTFTAPASGPSGTFAGGWSEITVATDSGGLAIAPEFTSNEEQGTYTASAAVEGLGGFASFALTNVEWYVASTGSDANGCDAPAAPCLTINGAIGKAAPGDTIKVATGTYTGMGSRVVAISKNATLLGGWDHAFTAQDGFSTVDGQLQRGGLYVDTPGMTTVSRFIIKNGKGSGIVLGSRGPLTVNESLITDNASGAGGGILMESSVVLNNSTVTRNTATTSGGGIGSLSQFYNIRLTVNNSTIAFNRARESGGGIYVAGGAALTDSAVTVQNSAVVFNSGTEGGGIALGSADGLRSESIRNSLIYGNTAPSGPDCRAAVDTSTNNIYGSTSGCLRLFDQADQVGVNPLLADYPVGAPPYFALKAGSPAIDAGNACLGTDQRGLVRPQGSACDIGPYEYVAPAGSPAFVGVAGGGDQTAAPRAVFDSRLVAYVVDAQGSPVGGVSVSFLAPAAGASGTFTGGSSEINVVTDSGGLAIAPEFTANEQSGTYVVELSAPGVPGTATLSLTNHALYVSPSGDDANTCDLPASACLTINGAIQKALPVDTILVAAGTYRGSGQLVVTINKSLKILGGWDSSFSSRIGASVIDGEKLRLGVSVAGGATVIIENFTIMNGRGNGAGISNSGQLTLLNSTVTGNENNADRGKGGGVSVYLGASLILKNTTIANNRTYEGGGIFVYSDQYNSPGLVTLQNSIVANNSATSAGPDCYGAIGSSDHSILGNSSGCSVGAGVGHMADIAPLLSVYPVGAYGYHTLMNASPAIDTGDDATCQGADQRGKPRPQGSHCDMGAYEYVASPGAVATFGHVGGSQRVPIESVFPRPLGGTVLDGSGSAVSGVEVTFTAPASGASGTFADSGTNTTTVLTDSSGIALAAAFTANDQSGSYVVELTAAGLPGTLAPSLTNYALYVSPSGNDSNSCDLPISPCQTIQAALNKAVDGDKVWVAEGTYTASTGEEVVRFAEALDIQGGWDSTFSTQNGFSTIDGQDARRGITSGGGTATVSRFIVTHGYDDWSAGGIETGGGALTLIRSAVVNNRGGSSTFGAGGVAAFGHLVLIDSLIAGNSSPHAGGILKSSGSDLTVQNSTISGNEGGGIVIEFGTSNPGARSTILNSTISNNIGRGLVNQQWYAARPATVRNSIIANNSVTDCLGAINTSDHNIIGDTTDCTILAGSGDKLNVNPQLGALLPDQGYHLLLPNSPALDAGNPATCLALDQRGIPRPQGAACDIGAVEMAGGGTTPAHLVSGLATRNEVKVGNAALTPPAAMVLDARHDGVPGILVTFTAPTSGPSGTFSGSGTNSTAVLTDARGMAYASDYTANTLMGSYVIEAAIAELPATAELEFANVALTISGNIGTQTCISYTGGSTESDPSGDYSISIPYNWSGTVTPCAINDHEFWPQSRSYSGVKTDLAGQNYSVSKTTPTILTVYPEPQTAVCLRPAVGARLLLTKLVRGANGSFDPSTVALRLDNPDGPDLTMQAKIAENSTNPASAATIVYTPSSNLAPGTHTVFFTHPQCCGSPLTWYWSFTAANTTCPTSAPAEAPVITEASAEALPELWAGPSESPAATKVRAASLQPRQPRQR